MRLVDHFLDGRDVGHIDAKLQRLAAHVLQFLDGLVELGAADVGQSDLGAGVGQSHHRGPADSLRPTRHNRYASLQT